jgi:hypothetical protein
MPDGLDPVDVLKGQPNGHQPALVPMTEDELRAAGRKLATLCLRHKDMRRQHAANRTAEAEERKTLADEIANLSETIASQGR